MYKALPIVFAAGAVAQSTITTQFLNLGFDNVPLASVIGADSDAVTYSIGCAQTDIDNGDCGLYTGFTVTAGPSIFEFQYTDDTAASGYTADFSDSVSCAIEGTTQAVCVESAGGSEANFPGVSTATVTGTDLSWGSLLITAGFDKLSATAGASASGSHASATGSSSSASETGGSSSSAQSGSRTSAGASATGSASSTALIGSSRRNKWDQTNVTAATASKSGSASGSAASATSTGGAAAQFAVPIAGVAGVLAAALAL